MDKVIAFAREELKRYYYKITGKDCNVALCVENPGITDIDEKTEDFYSIDVFEGQGKISGINERSVLLGVYRFLREIGCLFLRPGKAGERIPKKSEKECTARKIVRPDCKFRTITIEGATSLQNAVDLIDWSAKNGFNSYFTQFRDSHTFFERWYNHERNEFAKSEELTEEKSAEFVREIVRQVKKRGMLYHAVGHGWTCECIGYDSKGWYKVKDEEIPEDKRKYLAYIGGKRKFYLDTPLYSQLCYSSAEVRNAVCDEIVNYAEKHPDIDYLHFWLGDNYNNFCECEECKKKLPSDWYFMMLNEIDEKLTAKKLGTKIVFLIYFELLWPPKEVSLNNPDRFVMMFAPITRTFSKSITTDEIISAAKTDIKEYKYNDTVFPSEVEQNLSFLFAYKKIFKGDCFDFDYHLMWEPYKDLGGLSLAKIISEDVKGFKKAGLDGLVSCQVQKPFLNSGFGLYVMGHTLEDNSADINELEKEFFGGAYGKESEFVLSVNRDIENTGVVEYLRNETEEVSETFATRFADFSEKLSDLYNLALKKSKEEKDEISATNLGYYAFYLKLCSLYFSALALKAGGAGKEEVIAAHKLMHEFLFKNEPQVSDVLDGYYFDLMSEQILSSKWSVVSREH